MNINYNKNITRYIRWTISLIILIVLIFICFTIFNIFIKPNINKKFTVQIYDKPDYYIEKFKYTKKITTTNNQLNYCLLGTKMLHYPINNLFKIKYPVITVTSKKNTSITLSSNCAIVEKNHANIHMFGNVCGVYKLALKNKTINFKTEYLLFVDNKIVKTDQPIEIIIDNIILSSTGMIMNNATQELQLLYNVHGIYH